MATTLKKTRLGDAYEAKSPASQFFWDRLGNKKQEYVSGGKTPNGKGGLDCSGAHCSYSGSDTKNAAGIYAAASIKGLNEDELQDGDMAYQSTTDSDGNTENHIMVVSVDKDGNKYVTGQDGYYGTSIMPISQYNEYLERKRAQGYTIDYNYARDPNDDFHKLGYAARKSLGQKVYGDDYTLESDKSLSPEVKQAIPNYAAKTTESSLASTSQSNTANPGEQSSYMPNGPSSGSLYGSASQKAGNLKTATNTAKSFGAPPVSSSANGNSQEAGTNSWDDAGFVDSMKNWENGIKSGYDKENDTWSTHTSVEGGNDTIGYGHKITDAEKSSGTITIDGQSYTYADGIHSAAIDKLLKNDMKTAYNKAKGVLPDIDTYSKDRQNAIINMSFRGSLKGSPKTIKLIKAGEWGKAATEFLNNKEYKGTAEGDALKKRFESNASALAGTSNNGTSSEELAGDSNDNTQSDTRNFEMASSDPISEDDRRRLLNAKKNSKLSPVEQFLTKKYANKKPSDFFDKQSIKPGTPDNDNLAIVQKRDLDEKASKLPDGDSIYGMIVEGKVVPGEESDLYKKADRKANDATKKMRDKNSKGLFNIKGKESLVKNQKENKGPSLKRPTSPIDPAESSYEKRKKEISGYDPEGKTEEEIVDDLREMNLPDDLINNYISSIPL